MGFDPLWQEDDKPEADQALVVDSARLKAKKYSLDNRIYIVRGYETFVVHSTDIQVVKNADGTREVHAKNAKMVKYGEDGARVVD